MKSVFAKALIEDFSRVQLNAVGDGKKMVKLAFRFIKRRIFSFMTQKSLDLLSFFNFLHLKPDFLADKKEKREKLKDSFRSDE